MDKPFTSDIHLSDLGKIELSYNENRVALSFAALSFANSNKNKYKFMLKGLDTSYCSPTEQHSILYNNLTPGKYTFKVVGCNSDGVWNDIPAQIIIIVNPPFYATWWFKTIIALVIIALFYAFYRYRINQILALQKVRNRIAQDLHDDIGATLGSIKVFSEVAKKRIGNNSQKVEEVLDKIGEASHEMIDKMSDIVWSVNPINDSNEELLNRMKSFAAIMLTHKNIEYFFESKELTENVKLNMLQRKNIFLIFKESIYNAIKYANCSSIQITFSKEHNKLKLEIKDNGKGFDVNINNAFNGNGLKNIKSRAAEINAMVNILSKENDGARILLEINMK
jgi:two-component sensor histidine kinase